MKNLQKIKIENNEVGKRIDAILASKIDASRVTVQRLIEEEKILVNGKKTKASYKIQNADSIEVEKEEDFEEVMNRVVNVFRRIDDKSEVSYKFALNA